MGASPTGLPAHPPADAGQRRVAAQAHPQRAGQGVRLLPVQAVQRFSPVAVTPDELGEPGTEARSACPLRSHQWQLVRQAQCRRGHGLRLPPSSSATQSKRARWRPAPSSARAPCPTWIEEAGLPASPRSAAGNHRHRQAAHSSCPSAIPCRSRCAMPTAIRSSGRSIRPSSGIRRPPSGGRQVRGPRRERCGLAACDSDFGRTPGRSVFPCGRGWGEE